MTEYSRMARGSFVTAASPTAQSILLPFQPTNVTLTNVTGYGGAGASAPTQYAVTRAYWDVAMGNGTAAIEYIESSSSDWILAADFVVSRGISPLSQGLALQFGPQLQIASIAKASPTVITTASAHGLSVGQYVILEGLYQSSTTGMPQMSNMPFVITAVGSTTTFTVLWNSNQSNYTALSGSPSGAYVRQILSPNLYLPGVNFISAITTGATTTITTTTNHNFVTGQQIAFRVPNSWGTTQLNELPNSVTPGSPIYAYVTSVTSNTVFVCSFNSTGYTAFNSNQTVASVPGLSYPQVFAAGDLNTGGEPYSGGALYPSPLFPTSSNRVSTINGPAIRGAFVNNTAQGFSVGLGVGQVQSSALLLAASSTYVWEARLYDIG